MKKEPRCEERSNSLWSNEEIHQICKLMEEGHKATYIYYWLLDSIGDERITYERVRTLVKHIKHGTHWLPISSKYNINRKKFDYTKEKKVHV